MFRGTNEGKGFQIVFENGYTVSVQFGEGNYCENGDGLRLESKDAEVAVFWPEKLRRAGNVFGFYPLAGCDNVEGWLSADEVGVLLERVRALPKDPGDVDVRQRDPFGLMEGLRKEEEDDGAIGLSA